MLLAQENVCYFPTQCNLIMIRSRKNSGFCKVQPDQWPSKYLSCTISFRINNQQQIVFVYLHPFTVAGKGGLLQSLYNRSMLETVIIFINHTWSSSKTHASNCWIWDRENSTQKTGSTSPSFTCLTRWQIEGASHHPSSMNGTCQKSNVLVRVLVKGKIPMLSPGGILYKKLIFRQNTQWNVVVAFIQAGVEQGGIASHRCEEEIFHNLTQSALRLSHRHKILYQVHMSLMWTVY